MENVDRRVLEISDSVSPYKWKHEFVMKRGLRQGDPLTPFLFLIVAEGSNRLIESAIQKKMFEGVVVGKKDVEVFHLQFVDDTLVIGKSTLQNVIVIKSILRCFELCFGFKVNFHKSRLAALATSEADKWLITNMLKC